MAKLRRTKDDRPKRGVGAPAFPLARRRRHRHDDGPVRRWTLQNERIQMSTRSECGLAVIQVGYQIAPDEAGGWALTLRVADLPGGLLADQLGRTLVSVVQGSLEPVVAAVPVNVAH